MNLVAEDPTDAPDLLLSDLLLGMDVPDCAKNYTCPAQDSRKP
ncbi:MAG: hypothetical protein QNJ51_11505 [Calothrix sp. MO_167.B12]|nr:hypothetical protein [Calothrix sp. MO_167.B12]